LYPVACGTIPTLLKRHFSLQVRAKISTLDIWGAKKTNNPSASKKDAKKMQPSTAKNADLALND
jgi:hypothetical protein